MGDLSRRNQNIPVQARRAAQDLSATNPPDQIVIQVPGGQAVPVVPQAQPGTTQNIVYVVAPQGQPAATPPTTPPQEVHYHTTNNYEPLKRRRSEKGTSFFGSLAVVVGLIACGMAYVQQFVDYVKPTALTGLGLGAFGFLLATLFHRVGRGMPALGIMASLIAFPIWLSRTGQLQSQYDQIRKQSGDRLPAVDLSKTTPQTPGTLNRSASPAVPSVANPVGVGPTPTPAPHRSADHSIFGDGSGGWQKPDDIKSPEKSVAPSPSPVVTPQVPSIDRATAIANLEAARSAAATRLGVDYFAAKLAETAAMADYEKAKIDFSPSSQELIDSHTKELAASSKLHQIETQLDKDPAVAAAAAALKTGR